METNAEIQAQAKQTFSNTDYAFQFYNQVHPEKPIAPLREPKFSDFYRPSPQQKKGELVFLGGGTLALGYAAFHFL